jgi:hypothetical protein
LKHRKRSIKNHGEYKNLSLLQKPGKQFSREVLAASYLGLFNYWQLMITVKERWRENSNNECCKTI